MRRVIQLIVFGLILLPYYVLADTVALPYSYSTVSADSRYIFVMIAPIEAERDGSHLSPENQRAAQIIRNRYALSGLYLNNGSTEPLWTVDWYAYSVLVPSDGIHLIRRGSFVSSATDEALTFYANGQQIHSYTVGNLVDIPQLLPQTVAQLWWEKAIHLDDQQNILTVTTYHWDKYVFDIKTGKIISGRRPTRIIFFVIVVSVVFIFIILLKRYMKIPQ